MPRWPGIARSPWRGRARSLRALPGLRELHQACAERAEGRAGTGLGRPAGGRRPSAPTSAPRAAREFLRLYCYSVPRSGNPLWLTMVGQVCLPPLPARSSLGRVATVLAACGRVSMFARPRGRHFGSNDQQVELWQQSWSEHPIRSGHVTPWQDSAFVGHSYSCVRQMLSKVAADSEAERPHIARRREAPCQSVQSFLLVM